MLRPGKSSLCLAAFLVAVSAQPALAQPVADSAPAASQPLDPARLAAARKAVGQLFPEGAYARLMNGSMAQIVDGAMAAIGRLPLRDIARAAGASEADMAQIGPGTLKEMATIVDPAYEQRQRLIMLSLISSMAQIMTGFEPDIREGMSRAYAHRFTEAQLNDLNAFFATPSGALFAREAMALSSDPEMLRAMQVVMPKMMEQMPAVLEKARLATAALPPPRRMESLSPAERARLVALLGRKGAAAGK